MVKLSTRSLLAIHITFDRNKGNNKITELRTELRQKMRRMPLRFEKEEEAHLQQLLDKG